MMSLPPGLDAATLFTEFLTIALPFVSIAAIIASYIVIQKVFKVGKK